MLKIRTIPFTLLLAALLSCSREDSPVGIASECGVVIRAVDDAFTKNGVTPSTEGTISETTYVFISSSDAFVRHENASSIRLSLERSDWSIHVFANCSGLLPGDSDLIDACRSGSIAIRHLDMVGQYIPMYGHLEKSASLIFGEHNIPVTRLMSRIILDYAPSTVFGQYDIIDITFSQCPDMVYTDVCDYSPEECGYEFSLEASQVEQFSSGNNVAVYIPENKAGECPGIVSAWDKTPDFLRNYSVPMERPGEIIADNATYVSIRAIYDNPSRNISSLPVTFRFYLGSDPFGDFNILRNRTYSVTFAPSDESALIKGNWKVGTDDDNGIIIDIPDTGGDIIIK